MVVCVSRSGDISIVLSRSKSTIKRIAIHKKKRAIVKDRTVDFDKYNSLIGDSPKRVANIWLNSLIPMAAEARKELEMIAGIKKNALVGKYEEMSDVPAGVDAIENASDLKGRSIKSLKALFKKLTGQEKDFESEDEATAAVWAAIEEFSPADDNKKEDKKPREKVERSPAPTIDSDKTVFSCLTDERMRKEGGRYQIYAFLQSNGPSTVACVAEALGRDKLSVASDLRSMTIDNKVSVFNP